MNEAFSLPPASRPFIQAGAYSGVRLANDNVTAEQGHLSHKIGRGCFVNISNCGTETVLELELAAAPAVDWADPLYFLGAYGSIKLAQGVRFIRALTGIDFSEKIDADVQSWLWLQAAIIGRLAGTPFSRVDSLCRIAPSDTAGLTDMVTLHISLRSGEHVVSTFAGASAVTWLKFLSTSDWVQKQRSLSEFHDLPCYAVVSIARHTLSGHVLGTLMAGDIILPDSPQFSVNGEGLLKWGGLTALIEYLAPNGLNITAVEGGMELQETDRKKMEEFSEALIAASPYPAEIESAGKAGLEKKEPSQRQKIQQYVEEELTQSGQAHDSASIDTIPVMLDFQLGKVSLLLGDMRRLGVGSILQLADGSPTSIAIVSNGRTLGRGEVVDVSGRLGIRLIQWGSV